MPFDIDPKYTEPSLSLGKTWGEIQNTKIPEPPTWRCGPFTIDLLAISAANCGIGTYGAAAKLARTLAADAVSS